MDERAGSLAERDDAMLAEDHPSIVSVGRQEPASPAGGVVERNAPVACRDDAVVVGSQDVATSGRSQSTAPVARSSAMRDCFRRPGVCCEGLPP